MSQRVVFHVDVNSAFLSWEAIRRVEAGEEDLRLIPSCVGGDAHKRTGVVLAKSIPAKKYGIQTGEPVSLALRKCPNLVLVKPDFKLYRFYSHAFKDICREYTDLVESFSIDEVFMDMTSMGKLFPDSVKTACEIKDRIKDELGFTVNVGISTNKLLAKMASDFEKPDKVHTLYPEEIEKKMWPLPAGDLLWVGKSTKNRLWSAGIKTIGDIARADIEKLNYLVGTKGAKRLKDHANGIDESPVVIETQAAKSYSIETTFEDNIDDTKKAAGILLSQSDVVAARLRANEVKCGCVSVTIRDLSFKTRSHQRKLRESTDNTDEIYKTALSLFKELWKGEALRLMGISLSDIDDGNYVQMSLFTDKDREKHRKVDKTIDSIRNRFGTDAIVRGSTLGLTNVVGKKYKKEGE